MATLYAELQAYDEEGIFIADGSYLFVPDNQNYEGSVRLLFDEHNHPVVANLGHPAANGNRPLQEIKRIIDCC